MPVTAVLGGQWGDEGKGKIIDYLSEEADVVARFQGGSNAGHTILVGNKEIILHQIPTGILREGIICILGNGMVIDPINLLREINDVESTGVNTDGRIFLSLNAHAVTPVHKFLDAYNERKAGEKAIGTTRRGIGPAYTDKIRRTGIRIRDIENSSLLREKMQAQLDAVATFIEDVTDEEINSLKNEVKEFYRACEKVKKYIADTFNLIHEYIGEGKNIILEGAQGTLLDIDHGTYPYVTSSNTISGNICCGLGIPPGKIDKIIGVFKAYNTRVGAGPFPTEQRNRYGEHLQQRGYEFGATTRRKRRCGWFDAELARFAVKINGFDYIALTKFDVLDGLEEIKICTHYKNGRYPDVDLDVAEPVYETLPGWKGSVRDIRNFSDLPEEAIKFIRKIEDLLSTPIKIISTGKERNQIISME
ncbi:MAG: adenylosuccinate synthase [Candidatus Neomarinimicrobiota bacterium]|nr:MAG: adenylosuccinate synthase [Candidatus Neomarinimicrobiota bacterium]